MDSMAALGQSLRSSFPASLAAAETASTRRKLMPQVRYQHLCRKSSKLRPRRQRWLGCCDRHRWPKRAAASAACAPPTGMEGRKAAAVADAS